MFCIRKIVTDTNPAVTTTRSSEAETTLLITIIRAEPLSHRRTNPRPNNRNTPSKVDPASTRV